MFDEAKLCLEHVGLNRTIRICTSTPEVDDDEVDEFDDDSCDAAGAAVTATVAADLAAALAVCTMALC